jgi:hypothetical protein
MPSGTDAILERRTIAEDKEAILFNPRYVGLTVNNNVSQCIHKGFKVIKK